MMEFTMDMRYVRIPSHIFVKGETDIFYSDQKKKLYITDCKKERERGGGRVSFFSKDDSLCFCWIDSKFSIVKVVDYIIKMILKIVAEYMKIAMIIYWNRVIRVKC